MVFVGFSGKRIFHFVRQASRQKSRLGPDVQSALPRPKMNKCTHLPQKEAIEGGNVSEECSEEVTPEGTDVKTAKRKT
jgi:hypothetical protein